MFTMELLGLEIQLCGRFWYPNLESINACWKLGLDFMQICLSEKKFYVIAVAEITNIMQIKLIT